MPEQKQIIVEPIISKESVYGSRKEKNIKSCFSASPIHLGEISNQERLETYVKLVKSEINNGNGIDYFNPNYTGNDKDSLPDLFDVETGGGGLPSTPFTPNLTSPGPGSFDAQDQPAYEGEFKSIDTINNHGSGLGSAVSPSETTKKIVEQSLKIGQYITGRSYDGSNGS